MIFKIDINKFKEIEEKQIQDKKKQNAKNISDYEKRKEVIKNNESTTDIILYKNHENNQKDNQNDAINELLYEQKYDK